MIRYWLDKTWVQYLVLCSITLLAVYYWGWVFDFGYQFQWDILFTRNTTYGTHLGLEILKGLGVTVRISLISSALALGLGTVLGIARLSLFAPLRHHRAFGVHQRVHGGSHPRRSPVHPEGAA